MNEWKKKKRYVYEPVQVFTLIWWPQRCKNSSPMIWMCWYPKPRLKKTVLIPAFRWCKLFVMVVYHFHGKKTVLCQETVKKSFFFAAVKLHCPTSKNKFFHNLWLNGWILMISGMLGPSALQLIWPKIIYVYFLVVSVLLVQNNFCSRIFIKKLFFGFMAISVFKKWSS